MLRFGDDFSRGSCPLLRLFRVSLYYATAKSWQACMLSPFVIDVFIGGTFDQSVYLFSQLYLPRNQLLRMCHFELLPLRNTSLTGSTLIPIRHLLGTDRRPIFLLHEAHARASEDTGLSVCISSCNDTILALSRRLFLNKNLHRVQL